MMLQLSLDNVTLLEAIAWRDEHPEAYKLVVRWAHEDARKRGRCSMQRCFEGLRSPELARRLGLERPGEPYTINHNLRASLTRLVLIDHPSLPFRPRRSKCDPSAVAV